MPMWANVTDIRLRAVSCKPLVDGLIFTAGLGGKAPMVTGNSVSSSTVASTPLVESRTLKTRITHKKW